MAIRAVWKFLENLSCHWKMDCCLYIHEIDACLVPDWISDTYGIDISLSGLRGNASIKPRRDFRLGFKSHLRVMISLVVISQGIIDHLIICKIQRPYWTISCPGPFEVRQS